MLKRYCLLVLGVFSVNHQVLASETKKPFHWPQHYKAAVSLAYDDALDSQLNNAIPVLNKFNLKGSFYLTLSSPNIMQRLPEWRAIAGQGHELGNHTLFHQCSRSLPGREWVAPYHDVDTLSALLMRDQILLANAMLYAIDGKTQRTFTVPCADTNAGGENYVESIKSEFVAIKAVSGSGITPDMKTLDPYAVNVYTPSNATGKQLIALVKEAGKKGTMVNLTFHGVGGDYLTTSSEAHEELVKFLADNRELYWTDTFLNIMQYVKAR